MKKRLSVLLAVVVALTVLMLFSATAAADTQIYGVEQTWTQSWPATQESATFQVKVDQSGFYDWHITDNNRTGSLELHISDTESEEGYWFTYDLKGVKEATTVEKNVPLIANHTYDVTLYYTTEIDDEGDFDFLAADLAIVVKQGASQIQALTETEKSITVEDYTTTVFSFTTGKAGDYLLMGRNFTTRECHLVVLDPETFQMVTIGYIDYNGRQGRLMGLEANHTYYLLLETEGRAIQTVFASIQKTDKDFVRITDAYCYEYDTPWINLSRLEYKFLYSDGSTEIMADRTYMSAGYYRPDVIYNGEGYYDDLGKYVMVAGKQPITIYFYDQVETLYITVESVADVYGHYTALKPEQGERLSNSSQGTTDSWILTPTKTAAYDFFIYGNNIENFWSTTILEIFDETNRLVEPGENGYPLIGGKTYYMVMRYEGWDSALGSRLLFYMETGPINQPLKTGWKQEGGSWYYYDAFGHKVKNQWVQDSNGWCYLGEDGRMLTNQWVADSKGWCYVGGNGYIVKNSWVQDENGWYYLNDKGYLTINKWVKDSKGWCYLGSDGYMVVNNWVPDSKGLVYVGSNGYMVVNQWVADEGGLRYVGSDGYIVKNSWQKRNGKWSYIDSDGYIATGCWKKDSKGWCYLDEEGYMVTNNWVPDSLDLVYVGADGYMVVNKWIEDSNGWRYVGSDGYPTRKTWKKDSKGWCYLGVDGYMTVNDWVPDSKGYVFVGSNGYMVTNSWVADVEGLRYVGADGYITRNKWVKLQGKWCYLDADGYPATDCWKKDSKGWCYLDGEGFMVTNQWVPDSVGLVYVGSDGYMVVNKWIEDETGWRYAGPQGYYLKNRWQKDSKGWCYLQDNGYMVTEGWVKDSVGWCYLDASGYWDGKYFDAPPIEAA